MNSKLKGKESLMQINNSKMHAMKMQMENMKCDISRLKDLIQQPEQLKRHAKVTIPTALFGIVSVKCKCFFNFQNLLEKYTANSKAGQ